MNRKTNYNRTAALHAVHVSRQKLAEIADYLQKLDDEAYRELTVDDATRDDAERVYKLLRKCATEINQW